jgi:hypothetical protein
MSCWESGETIFESPPHACQSKNHACPVRPALPDKKKRG